VFFEGWKSGPDRENIASYSWDFGDGNTFSGFNAAHVYETPGVYTATLTVTDAQGRTATDSIQITVRARDGDTYYVDSSLGDDSYSGLCKTPDGSGCGPWQTATKAFSGAVGFSPLFKEGDQILFKRGQSFDLEVDATTFSLYTWGYMFGAYGSGAKPIIQAVGISGGDNAVLRNSFANRRFITFVDLDFNCTPVGGSPVIFWRGVGGGSILLFLRVDVNNFEQGFNMYNAQNVFIVNCTTYNSEITHAYFERTASGLPARIAILDTTMDYSGNHLVYGVDPQSAVIHGSTFSRPAFGRCAFRIAGGRPEYGVASNVWFSDNEFIGWIDPRTGDRQYADGTQYNYNLVQLAPSGPEEARFGEWLVFENNLIIDAQQLFKIATWEHVIIRNNRFITNDDTSTSKVRIGSAEVYDWRPCYDIQFIDNYFEFVNNHGGEECPAITVYPYLGPAYPDRIIHENIVISNNTIKIPATDGNYYVLFLPEDSNQRVGINSDNNIVYSQDDSDNFFGVGSSLSSHTTYTLADWQTLTGNDLNTQIYGD